MLMHLEDKLSLRHGQVIRLPGAVYDVGTA